MQQSCNTAAAGSWMQQRFDLSGILAPYRGQSVALLFHGTTAAKLFASSDFYLDDVAITYS